MLGTFQTKWVEALESGKYEQGIEFLCYKDEDNIDYFCCLGVGCEILQYPRSEVIKKYDKNLVPFDGEYEVSERFAKDIKLWSSTGQCVFPDFDACDRFRKVVRNFGVTDYSSLSLAGFNDNGLSFKNIATLIREFPRVFFKEPV